MTPVFSEALKSTIFKCGYSGKTPWAGEVCTAASSSSNSETTHDVRYEHEASDEKDSTTENRDQIWKVKYEHVGGE